MFHYGYQWDSNYSDSKEQNKPFLSLYNNLFHYSFCLKIFWKVILNFKWVISSPLEISICFAAQYVITVAQPVGPVMVSLAKKDTQGIMPSKSYKPSTRNEIYESSFFRSSLVFTVQFWWFVANFILVGCKWCGPFGALGGWGLVCSNKLDCSCR